MKALAAAPRFLTAIALVAAGLALVLRSVALTRDSDLLLALLVLATALGISFEDLLRLRTHARAVLALSIVPPVILAALAWALSRPFGVDVRRGLLATGLSSSEVATVGLVALARADATIALGAVTGSLIAAALLGPVAIGWLAGAGAHPSSAALLGRFALVVILPLVVGVGVRTALPNLRKRDEEREGVAAITVAVLVYAALSGAQGTHHLGAAVLASGAFLVGSAVVALAWHRRARRPAATPGAFAIAMRDFAVAAALATQAFGPAAGTVPGVYGVLMLVAGSASASVLRERSSQAP